MNGYISTSENETVADGFLFGGNNNLLGIKYLIEKDPRELNYASIKDFSDFPDEEEILFDAITYCKVMKIEDKGDYQKVYLK